MDSLQCPLIFLKMSVDIYDTSYSGMHLLVLAAKNIVLL